MATASVMPLFCILGQVKKNDCVCGIVLQSSLLHSTFYNFSLYRSWRASQNCSCWTECNSSTRATSFSSLRAHQQYPSIQGKHKHIHKDTRLDKKGALSQRLIMLLFIKHATTKHVQVLDITSSVGFFNTIS